MWCRAVSNGWVSCMCEDILRASSLPWQVKSINSLLCQVSTCFRWARSFVGAITQRGASNESPQTEPRVKSVRDSFGI
jgi:hypothetical protein